MYYHILLSLNAHDMNVIIYDMDSNIMLKLTLASQFANNYLGSLRYFMGIKVFFSSKGYLFLQSNI